MKQRKVIYMINDFRGKYFFLSNFYEVPIEYDGIYYFNSEAAFQAQKTTDLKIHHVFADLNASEAKKMGRKVSLRPDWEQVKETIMYDICKAKFSQNISLKQRLLDTGNEELVEENNWGDKTWGKVNGEGKNLLGKILMRIREELRNTKQNM